MQQITFSLANELPDHFNDFIESSSTQLAYKYITGQVILVFYHIQKYK